LPTCSQPEPCGTPENDDCTTWNCYTEYVSDHAWRHFGDYQEVKTCIPTCTGGCTSSHPLSHYHCHINTGLWDAEPERCSPDVHNIFVLEDGGGLCDAIPSGTPFSITTPETWAGASLADDRATWASHGTYTCTDLEDAEVPYISVTYQGRKRRDEKHWVTPWVMGQQKTCTLTCDGDEVPVSGSFQAEL